MSIDWKDTSYNSILVIIDRLTKMVYSKPVEMINAPELAKIISDIVIWYYNLSNLATETQSSPLSFGSSGITFKFDCGHHLCIFDENIE